MIHNYGRKLAGTKYINYALTTFSISQSKRAKNVGADNDVKYVCTTGRDKRTSVVQSEAKKLCHPWKAALQCVLGLKSVSYMFVIRC